VHLNREEMLLSPSALPSPAATPPPARRFAWALFWFIAGLVMVLIVVPFDARMVHADELDHSWMLALHAEHASKAVFGRDVVFNYGPLGFVLAPVYYPATFASLILSRLLIAAALLLVLFHIVRRQIKTLPSAGVWFALLVLFLATWRFNWNEDALPAIFASAALMIEFEFSPPPLLATCICVATLAMLSLAKASCFPYAAIVCAAICLNALLLKKIVRCMLIAASYICALLFGWTVLAHQTLHDVGPFISGTMEIIKGYPEAMGYGAKYPASPHDLAAFGPIKLLMTFIIACVAAALVAITACNQIGRSGRHWIAVVAIAAISFLIFKTTITRLDRAHLASGEAAILSVILISAATIQWKSPIGRRATNTLFALALLAFIFNVGGTTGRGIISYPYAVATQAYSSARAAITLIVHGTSRTNAEYETAINEIRATVPGVARGGIVDVYPWDAALAIALSDQYKPRPVLQSYQANTPALERIDAQHLDSSEAPDRVLFKIDPIDNRFPNLDDSLSWPVLLARYTSIGIAGDYAVLQPRATPMSTTLTLLSQRSVAMNQWISIPQTPGMIWAEMDIAPSTIGLIQKALLRPAALNLFVRQSDNSVAPYHMIRLIGAAGFLLSPVIDNAADFVSLEKFTQGDIASLSDHRVVEIKLEPVGAMNRFYYQKNWTLRLFSLSVHPR
jgi:hypothetical protein